MATINAHTSKTGVTTYRVRIQRKGQKVQTATFPTLKDARRFGTLVEARMIEGRHFPQKSTHTLQELLDRYTREVMPQKTPETQRSEMPVVRYWLQTLGHMVLTEIQPAHIIACRDERAKQSAPATVVKYLATLSRAFSTAMREYHWCEQNPCRLVRKPTLPLGRVRYLSDEERSRLLTACQNSRNRALYPLVILALATALRSGSLFQLSTQNVDVEKGMLRLEKTKNGSRLVLPLVGEALTVARMLAATSQDGYLLPQRSGNPWGHYRTAWQRAVQRARLEEEFSFHSLRHTAASYMVQAGIPLYLVGAILGHSSRSVHMTARYAHLATDNLRQALEVLAQRLSS